MPSIARLGDTTDHGGVIITSSPDTLSNGILIARVGDLVSCPIHGVNPIISGSTTGVLVNDKICAIVGSKTACGSTVITGSPDDASDPGT